MISTEMTQGVFLYILFDRFLDFDWALPVHPSDSALIAALMTAFFFFFKRCYLFPIQCNNAMDGIEQCSSLLFRLAQQNCFYGNFPNVYILRTKHQQALSSLTDMHREGYRILPFRPSCFHKYS